MTMITPSYLGETIEYSSLHACRSTLEDPTHMRERFHDRSRKEVGRRVLKRQLEDRAAPFSTNQGFAAADC